MTAPRSSWSRRHTPPPCASRLTLVDAGNFRWDIQPGGRINNGTDNAFDGAFDLAISTTVHISTDLGANADTEVVSTSSLDANLTAEDDWLITDDADEAGTPAVAHVFSDAAGLVQPAEVTGASGDDAFSQSFEITIPPRGRVVLMHLASQHDTRADAEVNVQRLAQLQGRVLDAMGPAEQRAVINLRTFADADDDGLTDEEEALLGTLPQNPDSDGDGLLDGFEVRYGFDPLTGGEGPLDPDGDTVTNLDEQRLGGDPTVADSDGDGLDDAEEVDVYGTDPTLMDTDEGGLGDGDEVLRRKDPLDPQDDLLSNLVCEGGPVIELPGTAFDAQANTAEAPNNYSGSCGGETGQELIFGISVPEEAFIEAFVTYAEFDTVMYMRLDACDDPEAELDCNDDAPFGPPHRRRR